MSEVGNVISFFGSLLRLFGMFVFGLGTGWFTWRTFLQPKQDWRLQAAAFLGFLFFSAFVIRFSPAGSTGGFLLGAAGTLLFFGLRAEGIFKTKPPSEDAS